MMTRSKLSVLCLLVGVVACSDDATGPTDSTVGGVDLDVLFAPPMQAEIDAVAADWATRNVAAVDVVVSGIRSSWWIPSAYGCGS